MATRTEELWVPDDEPDAEPDDRPTVTAHHTDTERTVFTESDNKEGWIATDLTVGRWR